MSNPRVCAERSVPGGSLPDGTEDASWCCFQVVCARRCSAPCVQCFVVFSWLLSEVCTPTIPLDRWENPASGGCVPVRGACSMHQVCLSTAFLETLYGDWAGPDTAAQLRAGRSVLKAVCPRTELHQRAFVSGSHVLLAGCCRHPPRSCCSSDAWHHLRQCFMSVAISSCHHSPDSADPGALGTGIKPE